MHDPSMIHVRLLVDDYTACFRFYRDILGFEPTFGDADSGYTDFETGDVTLALHEAAELEAALNDSLPDKKGRDEVCVILRVNDVDETAKMLRKHDVTLAAEPTDHPEWGIRTVHARDPDGTLIEFNESLDTGQINT